MNARSIEDLARSLRAMPPSARRLVEEAIELLLLACDEMDGDPDLEDESEAGDATDETPVHGLPEIARRFTAS